MKFGIVRWNYSLRPINLKYLLVYFFQHRKKGMDNKEVQFAAILRKYVDYDRFCFKRCVDVPERRLTSNQETCLSKTFKNLESA